MRRGFYIQSPDTLTLRWRMVGALLVISCLLITGFLWWWLTDTNNQISQSRLHNQADTVLKVLEKDMEINADVLYASRSLFFVDPELSHEEWEVFVKTQNIHERYHGITDLTYQRNGGIDSVAVALAKKTGVTAASSIGVSDTVGYEGTKEFNVLLALYSSVPSAGISEETRAALATGYVSAEVNVNELLDSSLEVISLPSNVSVALSDQEGDVFYTKGPTEQPAAKLTESRQLNVGQQEWDIIFEAPLGYQLTTREQSAPIVFLICGVFFTILILFIYLQRAGVRVHSTKRTAR